MGVPSPPRKYRRRYRADHPVDRDRGRSDRPPIHLERVAVVGEVEVVDRDLDALVEDAVLN